LYYSGTTSHHAAVCSASRRRAANCHWKIWNDELRQFIHRRLFFFLVLVKVRGLCMTAAWSTGGRHRFGCADAIASCRFESCSRLFSSLYVRSSVVLKDTMELAGHLMCFSHLILEHVHFRNQNSMSVCHCSEAHNGAKKPHRLHHKRGLS
jgi:hypothetical protein